MAGKGKKNGNGTSKSNGQKARTYSGVIKSPDKKRVTGRVFMRENSDQSNQNYYILLVIVTVLVGIVAMLVPTGSGIIDYFGLFGRSAAIIWFGIACLIFAAAIISTGLDKKLR